MIDAISISVFTYLFTYAKERFSILFDKLRNNFSALDLSNMIEKRSFNYVNRYVKTDMEIASIIFDRKRKIRWAGMHGNKYISYFQ